MSIVSTIVGIFCPPAGEALSLVGKAQSAIGGAVDWVTQSATHILIALLALSLAANGWQRHEAGVAARAQVKALASWQNAYAGMRGAYLIDAHSLDLVLGAIERQNRAVHALGDQYKAISAAEDHAAATGASAIAKARSISDTGRAEAKTWGRPAADCRTGPAGAAAAKQGAF